MGGWFTIARRTRHGVATTNTGAAQVLKATIALLEWRHGKALGQSIRSLTGFCFQVRHGWILGNTHAGGWLFEHLKRIPRYCPMQWIPKGGWITSYQLLWPWFQYIFIVFLLRVFMWFPSMGWNSNFSHHISELMSHKHPQALFLDGVQASTKLIRFTYQFSLSSLENLPPGFLISYLMGNTSRMTYRHRSKLSTRKNGWSRKLNRWKPRTFAAHGTAIRKHYCCEHAKVGCNAHHDSQGNQQSGAGEVQGPCHLLQHTYGVKHQRSGCNMQN